MVRRLITAVALLLLVPAVAHAGTGDIARFVLPPGNYGGIPTGPHSLDQLSLYSGLTPLRRNVSMADLNRFYLPDDFKPMPSISKGVEEIRALDSSGAYRVIYYARRADAVYVLHAFHKNTTDAKERS